MGSVNRVWVGGIGFAFEKLVDDGFSFLHFMGFKLVDDLCGEFSGALPLSGGE